MGRLSVTLAACTSKLATHLDRLSSTSRPPSQHLPTARTWTPKKFDVVFRPRPMIHRHHTGDPHMFQLAKYPKVRVQVVVIATALEEPMDVTVVPPTIIVYRKQPKSLSCKLPPLAHQTSHIAATRCMLLKRHLMMAVQDHRSLKTHKTSIRTRPV